MESANKRKPHSEKVGYSSEFSTTKSQSWKECKNSGWRITSRVYVYHWLKANPESSRYDIRIGTRIKDSSLCKDLKELEKQGKIFKAFDAISNDPDSDRSVHHYKVRQFDPAKSIQTELDI